MNFYDLGEIARCTVQFEDENGNPADPTTYAFKVRDPDGVITTYASGAITKTATGAYHADVPVTKAGRYAYRWEGTGAVTAAVEITFAARPSLFS